MVCAPAAGRTLLRCRLAVRPGADGETAGHHFSLCSSAVGLLAVAAHVCRSWEAAGAGDRSRGHSDSGFLPAAEGKISAAGFVRHQCGNHRGRAARGRNIHVVSACRSAGERRRFLCHVRTRCFLAIAPRTFLSAPRGRSGSRKSVGGAGWSGWGNGGGDSKSTTTPLPVGGMALVSRNLGAHDWSGASGQPGPGRSLRIFVVHRTLSHDLLERSGMG